MKKKIKWREIARGEGVIGNDGTLKQPLNLTDKDGKVLVTIKQDKVAKNK